MTPGVDAIASSRGVARILMGGKRPNWLFPQDEFR